MFPIRDHNPPERTPYVVYALITLNILFFLATQPAENDPEAMQRLYYDYAVIPARISQGESMISLISSQFLHAGLMHIAGNMLFLWIFGDNLEDRMGHIPFLIFYLASGVGAALFQVATEPDSPVPMIGASGAIAGVMGGYMLLFPRAQIDILLFLIIIIRVFPIPAWVILGLWFGIQLVGGVGSDPTGGGVAYWAHAGGFIAGLVFSTPIWLRLGGTRFWTLHHGHPPHPQAQYTFSQSRIPRVTRTRRPKQRGPWER